MYKELYLSGMIVFGILFICYLLVFMCDFRERIITRQYREFSIPIIILLIILFIALIIMCVNYGIQLSY